MVYPILRVFGPQKTELSRTHFQDQYIVTGLLQDKVITITDTSSGTGRATTTQCIKNNAKLLIQHLGTDQMREDAQQLQDELQPGYKAQCFVFAADLTVDGVAEELVQRVSSTFAAWTRWSVTPVFVFPIPVGPMTRSMIQRHLDINFTTT